jgi:RNA polymerase sigma-70 factor (ECF subfamily)
MVNDVYRKQYKQLPEALPVELLARADDLSATVEEGEQAQEVRAALLKLTADQQQVLALRFGAEFSLEEAALSMGKKSNAIKQLQFRALAALRRHLEEAQT